MCQTLCRVMVITLYKTTWKGIVSWRAGLFVHTCVSMHAHVCVHTRLTGLTERRALKAMVRKYT